MTSPATFAEIAVAPDRAPPSPRSRRAAAAAVLALGAALLGVMSTLMAGHWSTLPPADRADPEVQRSLSTLRAPGDEDRWMMVHVLYGACRCSQRIIDHLTESARPEGVAEKVILVGPDGDLVPRLGARGFAVEVVTKRALGERFHLAAAPMLVLVAPDGTIRYAGGYTDRKQGPVIADLTILDEVRQRGASRERPLFGCAVSKELQAILDPFGLKYSRDPDETSP